MKALEEELASGEELAALATIVACMVALVHLAAAASCADSVSGWNCPVDVWHCIVRAAP